MVDLYAAGESLAGIAREFNLTETNALTAIYRHPKELEKATKRAAMAHRRNENLATKIVLKRLEGVSDDEIKVLRPHDLNQYSEIAEREGKQANLAEGLATERTETSQAVNITVATPDTAKAIDNGISGGAIQL